MGYPEMDTVTTLTETATREEWKAVSGTSLCGYVTATRDEIEAVFGKPTISHNDKTEKVTTEWYLLFDDGLDTVATIYDWKRYDLHNWRLAFVPTLEKTIALQDLLERTLEEKAPKAFKKI